MTRSTSAIIWCLTAFLAACGNGATSASPPSAKASPVPTPATEQANRIATSVVAVYGDGARVAVAPWRFVYICRSHSTEGVAAGMVRIRDLDCGEDHLLLRLRAHRAGEADVEDNRRIPLGDIQSIRWEFAEAATGSKSLLRVNVTLADGKVISLPQLELSDQLAQAITGDSGTRIERLHLAGRIRTPSGEARDFLEPNLNMRTDADEPSKTLIELRFTHPPS
jgi:hypothetical protein